MLRALAALEKKKNLGSVPRTHMAAHNHHRSSFRGFNTIVSSLQAPDMHMVVHRHNPDRTVIHINKNKYIVLKINKVGSQKMLHE